MNSIEKTVNRISFCISENQSFQFLTFRKPKSSRLNCQIQKSGLEERMNVFSQSASRAEADSAYDSGLSLSHSSRRFRTNQFLLAKPKSVQV